MDTQNGNSGTEYKRLRLSDILRETRHRPWAMPGYSWMYYQEWNDAVFLHWGVEPGLLKPFVPNALDLDLFEGKAWVSLVAFTMEKIRPAFLPHFPPVSNFDEINIRTYVRFRDKPGVYFLSIEGSKRSSCLVARSLSSLPYRYSEMNRGSGRFRSENTEFTDRLDLQYTIGNQLSGKTALDLWLTERYALFQDSNTAINAFEIHHIEWPVKQLILTESTIHYPRFSSLVGRPPDLTYYSPGVQVIAWNKEQYR